MKIKIYSNSLESNNYYVITLDDFVIYEGSSISVGEVFHLLSYLGHDTTWVDTDNDTIESVRESK